MIILGADLSYSRSALVWYDTQDNKVFHYATVTIKPCGRRMLEAYDRLRDAIASYNYLMVDKLILEGPALNVPNPRTLHMLGELSGVFKMLCQSYGMDPVVVPPTEVRKFICGSGRATKEEMAKVLYQSHGISFVFDNDKGYDLSDAAALCIWGAGQ